MNFSTSTFLQNISDDSWSNLQCNWEIFAYEDELASRNQFCNETLQNLRITAEAINISQVCGDIKELSNLENDFNAIKARNQQLLSDTNDLRNTVKLLNKDIALSTTNNECLRKNIEDLEKESSHLTTDYKHKKIAYQKALQKYSTHFDMNIEVTDRSDISEDGIIKFGCPNSQSLKFVLDKSKRKIVKFDSAGILSKEEEDNMCKNNCVPEMLCNLREVICSKNVNDLK